MTKTASTGSTATKAERKCISDLFLPVTKEELSKFLLITVLMFCILFIQNIIRATKDSIVITLMGAETISFLKFWGVMPTALLFSMTYVKLVNVMKGEKIFYVTISIFIGFFALFAFVFYPYQEYFHLNKETAKVLTEAHPHLKWFIILLSNWSFALYYIITELWSGTMFALLFWQFVNNITNVEQSKRFYPIFGLLGQTGLVISGIFLTKIADINKYLTKLLNLSGEFNVITIQIIISLVIILGIIGTTAFWFLNHKIIDKSIAQNLQFHTKEKKTSFKESIKLILSSRYIRLITMLLICYGFAINLVEGPWKSMAKSVYKTPTEFATFVGQYLKYNGILTMLFAIMGSNIIRRLGWFSGAIITPLVILVTGLSFFAIANFDSVAALMMISFSLTDPVMLAVVIGAIQNILSKSSKYSLFDCTKEMSYVPLDKELKTKGKATADLFGIKLGKSAGAFVQSTMFIIIPTATYQSISSILMLVFVSITLIWISVVIKLNKSYKEACIKKENLSD